MTTAAIDTYDAAAEQREARLARVLSRAGKLRSIGGERLLFAVGGAFVAAGLLAIVVGWVGTSRTVLVAGQIPYVVSGGLLGLGLVFVGGFLYFGHWIAVMARENRESAAADRSDLEALRDSIDDLAATMRAVTAAQAGAARWTPVSATRADDDPTPPGGVPVAAPLSGAGLVATQSGSMMHRPACTVVSGRNVRAVSALDGLRPCGICRPLDERSPR